ncbi:MAG TPA: MTH1187 family thiamine-binding protein [Armatimonadota bacterium]|jgi:uncharacterized protein (TIGR00106 family)|nr:MTH1187 family thiamine-binding protein [Armatimonadota bacterium]HOP79499.1 MTH1187 family thiamine-binding protein [Armatimonadota bacterium]HPP73782.1 MTH1187 family thiamine-binding protein [Armatimonadota bacterium]
MSVVAEFSVTPMVEGEMKPYVDAAVDEVKKSGLKYEVDAMGTTIEGDLDQVLETIKRAHHAVRNKGVHRFFTELRIDDKEEGTSIDEEVKDYR